MKKILSAVLLLSCAAFAQAEPYTLGLPDRQTVPDTPQWATFHFQASSVFRLKSDYTNSATGGEAGVVILYDKNAPSLGLFVGYMPVEDRFVDQIYKIIPVTLRAAYDMQMTEDGVYLTMAAEGGGATVVEGES